MDRADHSAARRRDFTVRPIAWICGWHFTESVDEHIAQLGAGRNCDATNLCQRSTEGGILAHHLRKVLVQFGCRNLRLGRSKHRACAGCARGVLSNSERTRLRNRTPRMPACVMTRQSATSRWPLSRLSGRVTFGSTVDFRTYRSSSREPARLVVHAECSPVLR